MSARLLRGRGCGWSVADGSALLVARGRRLTPARSGRGQQSPTARTGSNRSSRSRSTRWSSIGPTRAPSRVPAHSRPARARRRRRAAVHGRTGHLELEVADLCCSRSGSTRSPTSGSSAFYFTGMFFNLFLPTIVGGDAVKAVLLARETGAPARSTMSVFMERNVGLCALLSSRSARAGASGRLFGVSLPRADVAARCRLRAANAVLMSALVYRIVDRVIAATPLARVRHRADALYQADRAVPGARGGSSPASACRSSSRAS